MLCCSGNANRNIKVRCNNFSGLPGMLFMRSPSFIGNRPVNMLLLPPSSAASSTSGPQLSGDFIPLPPETTISASVSRILPDLFLNILNHCFHKRSVNLHTFIVSGTCICRFSNKIKRVLGKSDNFDIRFNDQMGKCISGIGSFINSKRIQDSEAVC